MNIIDNKNDNKLEKCVNRGKVLFDYKSQQLWPEEDIEEDNDYVPETDSSISDDKNGEHLMEFNESNDELRANTNSAVDERFVAPIKISKKLKKKRMNWTIVGQQSQQSIDNNSSDNTGSNGFAVTVAEVKKRGRKKKLPVVNNGFTVIDTNGLKSPKKIKTMKKSEKSEKKNGTKRTADEQQNTSKDCENKKFETNYTFDCLFDELKTDFKQLLPQEILIRIFNIVLDGDKNRTQSIINLSQVCEHWRKLILTTPLLWQSLDLQTFSDQKFPYLNFNALITENQLFNNLKALNLNGWSGGNAERVLEAIVSIYGHNLRDLSLKNCKNISTNTLQTISSHCPNVEALDISAITYLRTFGTFIHRRKSPKAASHQNNQSPFASSVFRPLLELNGNKLLSLNLSENTMPSFPSCIASIMEFCPNLSVLDISNVESLSKSATIVVEKLQISCPKLRVLRAANITFTSTTTIVSEGFEDLEELSIPFNPDFSTAIIMNAHTDTVVEQLTKRAENLKLLDIRGARYITHRALVKIPAWNIQHLSVSSCPKLQSEQLEMAFTKWSKSLIDVDLSWNTSEESVNSCIKCLCEVGEESQLRTLQLRGSAVSYESLKSLLNNCTKLESIDLQSCRGMPRGIKRTYSGEEFVNLKYEVLIGKYE